jgi:hypothetical protein
MSNKKVEKSGFKALIEYADKVVDLSRRNRLLKLPKNAKLITFNMDVATFIDQFGTLDDLRIEFLHNQILHQDNAALQPSHAQQEGVCIPPTDPQGEKLIGLLNHFRLAAKRNYEEQGRF